MFPGDVSPGPHLAVCSGNPLSPLLSPDQLYPGSPGLRAVQAEAGGEALPHLQAEDRRQGHSRREDRGPGLLGQGEAVDRSVG